MFASEAAKNNLCVNYLLTMIGEVWGQHGPRGVWAGRKWGIEMELKSVKTHDASAITDGPVDLAIAAYLADAAAGDIAALFNLGVAYSTGSSGAQCDLIEAHKWFNLAASRGHEEAAWCRADVSDEMTAREIAEAQRRARQWLAQDRKAA